jgi:hypothetical protein
MEHISLALKICEGCGCVWCRPSDQLSAYCIDCRGKLEAFPNPLTRKKPGRPRKDKLDKVWAVATAEGGAL